MANSFLAITEAARQLDRATLLRQIGSPSDFPFVGDVENMFPINLDTASNLRIDEKDVHVLNFGAAGVEGCPGARLVRFNRKTTAVPCFCAPSSENEFCGHCCELWKLADERGFYRLARKKMTEAAQEYKPGKKQLLHRLPQLKEAEELYAQEIATVRQLLDDTDYELSPSWPDMHFKDMLETITVKAGVLSKETTNPV